MALIEKLIQRMTVEPKKKSTIQLGVFRWSDFFIGLVAPTVAFYCIGYIVLSFCEYGACGEGLGALLFIVVPFIMAIGVALLLFFGIYFRKRRPGISYGAGTLFVLYLINVLLSVF